MLKTNKNFFKLCTAVFLLVLTAAALRALALEAEYPPLNKLLLFTRTSLYIGLFVVWGFSVSSRIMQAQVRRILISVSALMLFWLAIREIKFRFVISPPVIRYIWYSYYIPILLIPLLALFVSLSLGKAESYRLPKWTGLLYLPAICLIWLMLTNDFHQLAFVFPKGAEVWNDIDYSYGIVFYLAVLWAAGCSLCALLVMLSKSRIPQSKKYMWIPLLPFAVAFIYMTLYSLRIPFLMTYIGDVAVMNCLSFAGFFEACIQCGLIQSNSRYKDLFDASVNLPLQIVDKDYRVFYASGSAEKISRESIVAAESHPIILNNKKRLSTMPVDGGYAVWTEDISALLNAREELADLREELKERNALLQLEYEKEREHGKTEEQNRLYDLLERSTQSRLSEIDLLVKEYRNEQDEDKKKNILARIMVLGSYIKRRKNFVLSSYAEDILSPSLLENALAESLRACRLFNINGGFLVQTESELVNSGALMLAYDFFEAVLEAVIGSAAYINVSVSRINGRLRITVFTDCEEEKRFSELREQFGNAVITLDEGAILSLNLEEDEL